MHRNLAYSPVQKYFYLKQHLDGDAARAIQGLPLTAENYPEAVQILQHRFGKDDVRKDTLVAKLLSLPGVTDADNIKSLRKLTDEVTAGVRSLRALDITNSRRAIPQTDINNRHHAEGLLYRIPVKSTPSPRGGREVII